jgi:hypothetical protein
MILEAVAEVVELVERLVSCLSFLGFEMKQLT